VCHIIDELLNIELYRRDYQFHQPVIAHDNEDANGGDSQEDLNFHGTQELNGIFIKENGAVGFDVASNRKVRTQGKIEETKINFFDPKGYDEQLFEKPEDEQILEARFDPVEWKAEVDHVYSDLVAIEKDLELIKQRGGSSLDDDIEDCRRHNELIVELCRDI
jgi:hypothetical protein